MTVNSLGIYEKALPQDLSWKEKFNLVKKLGFNFLEFSVDESDARLARLDWTKEQRKEFRDLMWDTDIRINNLMLSGHRRFPLGSKDPETRKKSLEMCQKAVDLCVDLGIHNIQMSGYDVYYEEKSENSRELYVENLAKCVHMAAKKNIMLSIETMDDPFITNIADIKQYKKQVRSPWLQAYPDLGNLSAWPQNDPAKDLENGIGNIVAIHLKDTLAVTDGFEGKFRDVPFGEGCVDFEGLLRELVRLDYNGSFTIEMWPGDNGDDDPVAEVKEAKAFFDKIFKKVGIEQEPVD
ncbi:L-ribulose-5-phosphate 3-epimerase [Lactobacillus crispatus]|uniref:L-ribulose-5-phosphate 3-epimerase n=1 Tax=Lactobacillus crispatus TaxID=47770 RepID=UPI001F094C31|nr:L-ribulose-5-phosphate 3-epimerase [Lactobacillus crispatus]